MKSASNILAQHLIAPKQDRSRASFERILDAAGEILEREGYDGLTLRAVSRKARTSIGSLYCRVKSKDDLIRVVQSHVLAKLDAESDGFTDIEKWKEVELNSLVPFLVRELGEFMRRNAAILRALQSRADLPVIVGQGEQSFWRLANHFQRVLLLHRSEIKHPQPERAVRICFDVTYACIQKRLGIGIRPDPSIGEGNWQQLLDDLAALCISFLQIDLLVAPGGSTKKKTRSKLPAKALPASGKRSKPGRAK